MKPLQRPLKSALDSTVDERAITRVWRGIAARRARPSTSPWGLARIATVTAFISLTLVLAGQSFLRKDDVRAPETIAAGPLELVQGGPIPETEVPEADDPVVLAMADESRVIVAGGARLEPLVSSASRLVLALRHGKATFEVTPGGSREWVIEAGLATVQVVGTRFEVLRDEDRVVVSVQRGIVLVRRSGASGDVQRLEAGQRIEVLAPLSSARVPRDERAPPLRTEKEPPIVKTPPRRSEVGEEKVERWRRAASLGRFEDAYQALGPGGIPSKLGTALPEELLTLADVARLSGHPGEAIAPLTAVLDRHSGSSQASLAAVTLGRLQLDVLGHPRAAASAFERALALGAPIGLEEDILVRLIEAYARAGDRGAAKERLGHYERRFPNGRRRNEVVRWLDED